MIDDVPAPATSTIELALGGQGHHTAWPGEVFDLNVHLLFHPDSPYSVEMFVGAEVDGEKAEVRRWEFARELMHSALLWGSPQGMGDIRFSVAHGNKLCIRLMDPTSCPNHPQHFDMHLPARPVRAFLRRTLNAVPAGSESSYLKIDAQLGRLFA